jgi:hypothetical protein
VQYVVAFGPAKLADVQPLILASGASILGESCDHITCEARWRSGVLLRRLCRNKHWQIAQVGPQTTSMFAAFVFAVSTLTILGMSCYGMIVFLRCQREALGDIPIGEATLLAIVSWLGLCGLISASRPR